MLFTDGKSLKYCVSSQSDADYNKERIVFIKEQGQSKLCLVVSESLVNLKEKLK